MIEIYLKKQFTGYKYFNQGNFTLNELKLIGSKSKYAQITLNSNETVFKRAFPSHWEMDTILAQSISNWIKEDIIRILSSVPAEIRIKEDLFIQSLSEANSFDRYIQIRFKERIKSTVTQAFQDFHYFLFESKEDEFIALKKKILPKDSIRSVNRIMSVNLLLIVDFDRFFTFFSDVLNMFIHLSSMSSGVLLVQFSFFLSDCLESLNEYIENQFDL